MADIVVSLNSQSAGEQPAEATPQTQRPREPLWRHLVGDQLRRLRHERGETLGKTATRAGVSPQYLSEIERGRKEPSSEMIAAVTRALDTTLVDLTLDIAERLIAAREHPTTQLSANRSNVALAA
ncbi:helix-turn-helix domain-containing protein [Homoserinimonas sp. A520]